MCRWIGRWPAAFDAEHIVLAQVATMLVMLAQACLPALMRRVRPPCPGKAHTGRTFCSSDPTPGQCDALVSDHSSVNTDFAASSYVERLS